VNLENKILFDISPVISPRTAVFPGDTPFSQEFLLKTANGAHLDLSTVKTTVHIGAHTDAPSHYQLQGSTIEKRDLRLYLGSAQVIEVHCGAGGRIRPADVKTEIKAPRILFKTETFPDPEKWNDDFAALSAELIEWLAEKRVRLVGIDTPSVDPSFDADLESHKAIFKHDMAILEGIVLTKVPAGLYDLICLPLKIEGSDASPVRAVLLK
jgi:arylformamidase